MKKYLLLICLVFTPVITFAQDDELELDVLRAPASPASNLLGTATTDIDKPSDVKSFMASIQSASNSYTKFPSNYAMDFAPFYIFNKNTDFTTEGLRSEKYSDIFKQTFIVSTAITRPDSTNTSLHYGSTYAALGFKFSICRGKYSETIQKRLDVIITLQNELNKLTIETIENDIKLDEEYRALLEKRKKLVSGAKTESELKLIVNSDDYKNVEAELSKKLAELVKADNAEKREGLISKIKMLAADFQLERTGFSWDVNGGVSTEFRNKNFSNSKIYNAGLWTNAGYTTKGGLAFLGLVRYLYNPDKIYALDGITNEYDNLSTFDAGIRIAYSKPQSKFSCSVEAINRSVLSGSNIDPTHKLLFNADYSIFKNQKLTFSFGKDFDGTITKEGNLIAALTFIQGFGR